MADQIVTTGGTLQLMLDDIDRQTATLSVHGKGGRIDRLPLPVDVGGAGGLSSSRAPRWGSSSHGP